MTRCAIVPARLVLGFVAIVVLEPCSTEAQTAEARLRDHQAQITLDALLRRPSSASPTSGDKDWFVELDGGVMVFTSDQWERLEEVFVRELAAFDTNCESDKAALGFAGGATVGLKASSWLFLRGDGNFSQAGSTSVTCTADGAGPPPRTLTIDGSSQFRTFTFSLGPQVNAGPFVVFATVGVGFWRNDFVFADRLVVGGQQVAGSPTDGEETGTAPVWTVGTEIVLWREFLLSAKYTGGRFKGAFPENDERVPEDVDVSVYKLSLAWRPSLPRVNMP
jgi:hypothetical protein